MRATRNVAPAAAAPATACSATSPKRTRRAAKGRRGESDVGSAADTRSSAVDLRDRLLGDHQDALRDRLEQELRPELLAPRHGPEEGLLELGGLGGLGGGGSARGRGGRGGGGGG